MQTHSTTPAQCRFFSGTIIRGDIVLNETTVEELQVMEQFSINVTTTKEKYNCIKHMHNHWERFFPDYYCTRVQNLMEEDIMDSTKFFLKNKKNIIYKSLNLKFAKALLLQSKKSKQKDFQFQSCAEVLWCSSVGAKGQEVLLSVSFYQAKEKFLAAFKKQVKTRKEENVDKNKADSIPNDLCEIICTWAIKEGNVMLWVWTVI